MIKRNNLKHQLLTQMGQEHNNTKKEWPTSEIKAGLTVIGSVLFLTFGLYYLGSLDFIGINKSGEELPIILIWMMGFLYLIIILICVSFSFGLYCLYKHLRDNVF